MVDNSYLGTSDEVRYNKCYYICIYLGLQDLRLSIFVVEQVNKLIERLEAAFIKHFSNGNRRKGMKALKPGHKTEKHRTTFFLGNLITAQRIMCHFAIHLIQDHLI